MLSELSARVLEANVLVHTKMAATYSSEEPHFRLENREKVRRRLRTLLPVRPGGRMLDLGCGTGFMISIGAEMCSEVVGVDATQAMLDCVERHGPAQISLICDDTATADLPEAYFDVATCYSFLHHLADLAPTLRNAARSLRPGGTLYADLEPNFYFWDAIRGQYAAHQHTAAIHREIANTIHKDRDVLVRFGIAPDSFNHAEYFKNIRGGFREDELRAELVAVGFTRVEFFYQWFLGEALLLNEPRSDREQQLKKCAVVHHSLEQCLPLSRHLFKYVGFTAVKA